MLVVRLGRRNRTSPGQFFSGRTILVASTRGSRRGEVEGKEQICYWAKFGILTWSRDTESECTMLDALFFGGRPCSQGSCHHSFRQWSHCALRARVPARWAWSTVYPPPCCGGGGDIGVGSGAPLLCEMTPSPERPWLLAWCGGLEEWRPPFAVTSRARHARATV